MTNRVPIGDVLPVDPVTPWWPSATGGVTSVPT